MKKLGVLVLFMVSLFGMLPKATYAAEAADFDREVIQYLDEISTIRGFEVTKEMLEDSMAAVSQDFSDLKSIDEVKNYFGEIIWSDYGNLRNLLDTYQLTLTELRQLLADYGEELNDYVFLDELEFAVYFYHTDSASVVTEAPAPTEVPRNTSADTPVYHEEMLAELLTLIDISEQDIQKLSNYMASKKDYFADPLFLVKMNKLQNQLETIAQISEGIMTEEQASLCTGWLSDFFTLLRLKAAFFELKDGSSIPLTIEKVLLKDDFLSGDLKLKLFSADSKPLADILLDHTLLEALLDNLDTVAKDFGTVLQSAEQTAALSAASSIPRTEKGGRLPKTEAGYIPGIVLGAMLLFSGLMLFKKAKHEKK